MVMKTITATIKPFKLDEVKDALAALGVRGFRVVEVKGFGKQRDHTEMYRGAEHAVNYLPKIDVIVTVRADDVDRVIEGIMTAARTGRNGDGRITVSSVDKFLHIRTGENAVDL